jgi:hypothetical protein
MNSSPRIAFFYPSNQLGGAELLLVRYFNFLLENSFDVYFITRTVDEIYYSIIPHKDRIISIGKFQKKLLNNNIVIILPVPLCFFVEHLELFKGAKLITWALHPGLITQFISKRILIRALSKILIRNVIRKLSSSHAIWFLDNECFYHPNLLLNLNVEPIYMPLLIEGKQKYFLSESLKPNISIAFVQRMVPNKLIQVKFILDELISNYPAICKQVNVHFVGEGEGKYLIEGYNSYFKNVSFHGFMNNENLINFLNKHIDITFGMGQTAIDAGYAYNLSIVVDLVNSSFEENEAKFNFIYDLKGFSIGELYDKFNYCKKQRNLDQLIQIIKDKKLLEDSKILSYDYVSKNFMKSNEKIKVLRTHIENCQFVLTDNNIKRLTSLSIKSLIRFYR